MLLDGTSTGTSYNVKNLLSPQLHFPVGLLLRSVTVTIGPHMRFALGIYNLVTLMFFDTCKNLYESLNRVVVPISFFLLPTPFHTKIFFAS